MSEEVQGSRVKKYPPLPKIKPTPNPIVECPYCGYSALQSQIECHLIIADRPGIPKCKIAILRPANSR